jgi:hypothetical protein
MVPFFTLFLSFLIPDGWLDICFSSVAERKGQVNLWKAVYGSNTL